MATKKDTGKPEGITKGRARRVLKVGELATSVGGSYVWQAIQAPFRDTEKREKAMMDTHVRNALRLVEGSKELRGAFTKLVQLLSMRDDILPGEVRDVLSATQSSVPPMDYELIRTQIESELGAPPEKVFASFEPEAFAAASLGQVHRATRHDGTEVVVKVQYPGVDETVRQDLLNLKALLQAFTRFGRDVMRQKIDQSDVYRELEERLYEELDYINEAKNIAVFQRMFADDDEVLIPAVYPDQSSRRVLTMGRIDGYPLATVLGPGVDQETRDWVADKLFRVLWRQVFEFGSLHTDPNPGNYLVTFHPKLAMLDFGSIRVFPEPIRKAYRGLARAILENDEEAMGRHLLTLEFLDPEDDPRPLFRILRIMFEPVLEEADYDPRSYDPIDKAMTMAGIALENRVFKDPGHRVFLIRALMGLDAYLKQAGTIRNWARTFRECIESAEAADARRSQRRKPAP